MTTLPLMIADLLCILVNSKGMGGSVGRDYTFVPFVQAKMGERKDTVTLISSDGFRFVVDYKAACVSNTIKGMLSTEGNFMENEQNEVKLQTIRGAVLERICQYFYYKLKYQNSSAKEIPEFHIQPEIALELMVASHFLDT
eukprot:TRINITY_DN5544_c1_g1_i2.p3 TRINITY_DN5544_c1_g1~~TRINITY_DN5544_c1_g1_i2.p3  ORF type:complete len:141 (-),score=11.35 TRINITY_DN5544_c1_g1_i2:671-1093(-)